MNGRNWAYAGILLGGAVSIAANVAHSFVPPAGAAPDWHPNPGAVIGTVFWPIFVFIAIEIFARIAWPQRWHWAAVRFVGILPVAVVAAIVSYRHLRGLLLFYGEDIVTAALGPIAVDGLMVMATAALIATGHTRAALATPAPADAPAEPLASEPAPSSPDDRDQVVTDLNPLPVLPVTPQAEPDTAPDPTRAPVVPVTPLPVVQPRTNGHAIGSGVVGTGVVR